MTKVQYELMTPREVIAAQRRAPIAFLPIGPLEWHGPHLPAGMDGLHAHGVARRVAEVVGGVVLPPYYVGSDSLREPGEDAQSLGVLDLPEDARVVGMDFPGNSFTSLYFDEGVLGVAVREIVEWLKREPYRLIVILNGHGARNHQRTLRRVAAEADVAAEAHVRYVTAWVPKAPPASDPGHAERFETSVLMALEPDHVRIEDLPPNDQPLVYKDFGIVDGSAFDGRPSPGFLLPRDDDPRESSAEEGRTILRAEVERIVREVRGELERLGVALESA